MTSLQNTKELHGLKYFTGNHSKIRAHYRAGNRPSEFGNKVWATSLVMIDYLQTKPFELEGLRVLEIGCGWGLLGVYLANQYNCNVTCSDFDEHVLPIAQLHAQLNQVNIHTMRAAFSELSTNFLMNFDLIIGAEVCYSEDVAKEIDQLLKRAQQAKVKRILIGDPGRPDFHECFESCKNRYTAKLVELSGSVNGKKTQVLSIFNI